MADVSSAQHPTDFVYAEVFRGDSGSRIAMIRRGVPASTVKRLVADLGYNRATILGALRLSTTTINRKAARDAPLASNASERVLGLVRLIGQVEVMAEESGLDSACDAPGWLAEWLAQPLPELDGVRPLDLLDTMEGQGLIRRTLAQTQIGA